MRSGGRSVLSFDADLAARVLPRLNMDSDIPALVAIHMGVVVNVCRGLREFTDGSGPDGEVLPEDVTEWLEHCGMLVDQLPDLGEMCRIRPEEEALMEYVMTQKPSTEMELKRFDCGVSSCNKAYFHEHVGLSNEQQSGLILPEQDVLGPTEEPIE